MIKGVAACHIRQGTSRVARDDADKDRAAPPPAGKEQGEQRLRRMFDDYFDFTWRSLRRFGLREDAADDAVQRVFLIASRKLDAIHPGSERSFLFATALRVASDVRRSAPYRREVLQADPAAALEGGVRPDEVLDQRRARAMLDDALGALDDDLRVVFALFELEELTSAEIAVLLDLPPGTVASRLRRARVAFKEEVAKLQRGSRRKEVG